MFRTGHPSYEEMCTEATVSRKILGFLRGRIQFVLQTMVFFYFQVFLSLFLWGILKNLYTISKPANFNIMPCQSYQNKEKPKRALSQAVATAVGTATGY